MSLKELVRRVRQVPTDAPPSLIDLLQRQALRRVYERPPERRDDVWHPSEIAGGFCPRAVLLSKLRPDLMIVAPKHSPETQRIFDMGISIHWMYQNLYLGPLGVLKGYWVRKAFDQEEKVEGFQPEGGIFEGWTYQEYAVYDAETNVGGHIDGHVVENSEYLVEFKSARSSAWRSRVIAREPYLHHKKQIMFYLHAYGVPNGIDLAIVLYHNKDTQEEAEFPVRYDRSLIAKDLEDLGKINEGLAINKLPPRLEECSSKLAPRAKKCGACTLCFHVEKVGGSLAWVQAKSAPARL